MLTTYIILILFIVLLGIGIWLILRMIKKRKAIALKQNIIPEDILAEFNYAENTMKGGMKYGSDKQDNAYSILWEIAKGNRFGESSEPIRTTKCGDASGELHEQSEGRQDIQDRTNTNIGESSTISRKHKPNNIGNIISRFRRNTARKQ